MATFTFNSRTLETVAAASKVVHEGQEYTLAQLDAATATRTAVLTALGVGAATETIVRNAYATSGSPAVVQKQGGGAYTGAPGEVPAYAGHRRHFNLWVDTTA